MSYERLELIDGVTKWDAAKVQHLENGIVAAQEAIKNYHESGSMDGGVQADWERNDPAAADYIKNRPFFTDDGEKYNLISQYEPEFTITGGEDTYRGVCYIPYDYWSIINNIKPGQVIIVNIDGKDYEGELDNNMWARVITPEDISDTFFDITLPREEDGEIIENIKLNWSSYTSSFFTNIIISIDVLNTVIHQIPLEYIPMGENLMSEKPVSGTTILQYVNDLNIPRSYDDLYDLPVQYKKGGVSKVGSCYLSSFENVAYMGFILDPNKKYNVKINEITYSELPCKIADSETYYIGNGALVYDWVEDTGENFVIYGYGASAKYIGDNSVHCDVYEIAPDTIKQLEEKCIPDTIARAPKAELDYVIEAPTAAQYNALLDVLKQAGILA